MRVLRRFTVQAEREKVAEQKYFRNIMNVIGFNLFVCFPTWNTERTGDVLKAPGVLLEADTTVTLNDLHN